MGLLTADEKFIRNLQLLDSLLSVRYSDKLSSWVIARKAAITPTEYKFLSNRLARLERWSREKPDNTKLRNEYLGIMEEWRSAKAGERIIFFTRKLDRTTFDRLISADIRRYGGYSRMADELERLEQEEERKRARTNEGILIDTNKEMFDQVNFMWRTKSARLDHGITDLNTLLHGR